MKYFWFGLLLALMVGCATTAPGTRTTYCIHPAIQGGAPFELPDNAKFERNGGISFTFEDKAVTVWGAYCVAFPKESQ